MNERSQIKRTLTGAQASLPATPRLQRRKALTVSGLRVLSDFGRHFSMKNRESRTPSLYIAEAATLQARMPALQSLGAL